MSNNLGYMAILLAILGAVMIPFGNKWWIVGTVLLSLGVFLRLFMTFVSLPSSKEKRVIISNDPASTPNIDIDEALELLKKNGLDLKLLGLLTPKCYYSTLHLVESSFGKHVLRLANKRLLEEKDQEGMSREYKFVGFTHHGDDLYRHRGVVEQVEYANYVRKCGFKTPVFLFVNRDFMLREYIEGEVYNEYLGRTSDVQMVVNHLTDLVNMHQKDIVIGDMNGTNTILANGERIYIDFDIELKKILGETERQIRKDFELAQALYYSVKYLDKKENIFDVRKTILELFSDYDVERIKEFLSKYIEFKEFRIKRGEYDQNKANQYKLTNDIVRKLK